jgi:hypothetical protein
VVPSDQFAAKGCSPSSILLQVRAVLGAYPYPGFDLVGPPFSAEAVEVLNLVVGFRQFT